MKTLTLVLIALGLCFSAALAETPVTNQVEHSVAVSGDFYHVPVLEMTVSMYVESEIVLPVPVDESVESPGYPSSVFHPPVADPTTFARTNKRRW